MKMFKTKEEVKMLEAFLLIAVACWLGSKGVKKLIEAFKN